MNYAELYETLYKYGYHDKAKNHGVNYVKHTLVYDYSSVLDCGCSNGQAVKTFQKNHKRAFGIDVSTIAIRLAQEKFGTINCNVSSVLDIPFKDNFFDAVFTCDMLEHLMPEDVDQAIKEIKRVAKKWLFIKVSDKVEGNTEHIDKIHDAGLFRDIKNLHITVISLDEWIKKFESCGKWKYREQTNNGMFIFNAVN